MRLFWAVCLTERLEKACLLRWFTKGGGGHFTYRVLLFPPGVRCIKLEKDFLLRWFTKVESEQSDTAEGTGSVGAHLFHTPAPPAPFAANGQRWCFSTSGALRMRLW